MSRRVPSLELRLTLAVVVVLGASLLAFAVGLHAMFGRALLSQFDARLLEDARAVANTVEERADGSWEFEPGMFAELEHKAAAFDFEIFAEDGTVFARSPSLGTSDLPRSTKPTAVLAVTLPSGARGRVRTETFLPQLDEEVPSRGPRRSMTVAVGRATAEIEVTMAKLRGWLWSAGLAALVLSTLAGAFAVRRGLRPVDRLCAGIDAIDAQALGMRLPADELPPELRKAVLRLNELLARLEASFARERRFSADVSHELRTPLAGLRSILEVAASRPRSPSEYQTALDDALAVAQQMSGLAESLLMLSRIEANEIAVRAESVDLRELVEEAFKPFAEKARARGLCFENLVPEDRALACDREKLRIVLSNLLSNAVEYTAPNGRVSVESDPQSADLLAVCDSGPPIPEDSLQCIFERFFRLDQARSGGEHAGIGLALVRALCEALGLNVAAENHEDGSVAFRLRRAPAISSPSAEAT